MKVLFVSNGHGEDAIGAHLAARMRDLGPGLDLEAVPLVGRGAAYERAGLPVLGPRLEMPSGAFMLSSPGAVAGDLRAGYLQMTREHFRAIGRSRPDAVVVVGDLYALWVAWTFARSRRGRPRLFQVQPLVSAYYGAGMTWRDRLERLDRLAVDNFLLPERLLMRACERVYTRDERSAALLRARGLHQAVFVGNPMMDLVIQPELDLGGLLDGRPVLALLPGTRRDYLFSLPVMLETAARLPEFQSLAAFGGDLRAVELPAGWRWVEPGAPERSATASLVAQGPDGARVPVLGHAFAAVLQAANLVLGTSGTGNEQAAGLGRPVVGFPTAGPQYLPAFARAQRRLLGKALELEAADPTRLAGALRRAAGPDRREWARRAGLERMGTAGGTERVVLDVLGRLGLAGRAGQYSGANGSR